MRQRLSAQQAAESLTRIPAWTLDGDRIHRQFPFGDFADAIIFVNKVAELAEEEEHHPDILVEYNKVTLTLSTHDAGGLTAADFQLARRIDEIPSSTVEDID